MHTQTHAREYSSCITTSYTKVWSALASLWAQIKGYLQFKRNTIKVCVNLICHSFQGIKFVICAKIVYASFLIHIFQNKKTPNSHHDMCTCAPSVILYCSSACAELRNSAVWPTQVSPWHQHYIPGYRFHPVNVANSLLLSTAPVTYVHPNKGNYRFPDCMNHKISYNLVLQRNLQKIPCSYCFKNFYITACVAVKYASALLTVVMPPRVVGIIWNATRTDVKWLLSLRISLLTIFYNYTIHVYTTLWHSL